MLMIDRMADNDKIVTRYLDDPDFQEIVFAGQAEGVHETIAGQQEQIAWKPALSAPISYHANLAA